MPIAVETNSTSAARFLTEKARTTALDGIRNFYPYETPDTVSFLAGRPNYSTFPIGNIRFDLDEPNGGKSTLELAGADLQKALQYGPTCGFPCLRELLVEFQSQIHRRAKTGWGVMLGNGCQDLIYKALVATLNPGDSIICETPMYAGILPTFWQIGANCVEVHVDDYGISADQLEKVLESWPADKKRPRVLYSTNPIGGNPTGASATRKRKMDILKICAKYDILIFEDDPYYYLTTELVPSYFELETEVIPEGGLVMRFDSFSKVLAGGFRLGYVTAPVELLYPLEVQMSLVQLHASAISQMVVYKILAHWGVEGFLGNAMRAAKFYEQRKVWFLELAQKHLGDMARWQNPLAGLFIWVDLSPSGVEDSEAFMYSHGIPHGFLACPGTSFYPSRSKSAHIRVSFSEVSEEAATAGFERLAKALRQYHEENQA